MDNTDLSNNSEIVTEIVEETQPIIQTEIVTQPIIQIVEETQPIIQTEIVTQPITQIVEETQPIIQPIIQIVTEIVTQPIIQIETNTDTDISNNINNKKNSINVFDPNVKNIYRPKNSWGPVIWNFIHTISIIDFLENEMYVNQVKKYLQSVFNILPCEHCCETYKIWIDKLDTIDINERMVLFKWSVDLHNEVNQKLNKQTWTYEQAVEHWCNKLPELPLL
jgi:hypothetical protein